MCTKNLHDFQLALVLCRLYEGEFGPTYQSLLRDQMIPHYRETGNTAMVSICHWLLKQYPEALNALLDDPADRRRNDARGDEHDPSVRPASPSLSAARARAALGSAADTGYLKQKLEATSNMRKISIKDQEKQQKEYYDPVICECIMWLKNHVLLRETPLDARKFVCGNLPQSLARPHPLLFQRSSNTFS